MAKFKFELEDVLDYRNFEQQQAQSELAKALSVETGINNKLNLIAQQYAEVKSQMNKAHDFSDIVSQSQFYNLLNYQKEELLKELAKAKIVSEEKRKILQEAMKKTSALEKLKEQKLEEFRQEENRKEEDFADEISNSKYSRL